MYDTNLSECIEKNLDTNIQSSTLSLTASTGSLTTTSVMRRRCSFQWQICVFSVMIAFLLGIALGVLVPMIGDQSYEKTDQFRSVFNRSATLRTKSSNNLNKNLIENTRNPYEVSFVTNTQKFDDRIDRDNRIDEDTKHKLKFLNDFSKNQLKKDILRKESFSNDLLNGIIDSDIYWGEIVEKALPKGFHQQETDNWSKYIQTSIILRLEIGCGRMQNRLVIFQDGKRACARYRQNTDQIQGEIFSFYLGQLMNLSNIVPSAASLVDTSTNNWELASEDIANAQWKSFKPVILTRWLPDLEPAGIPMPFQTFDRHLNKMDVINITKSFDVKIHQDVNENSGTNLKKSIVANSSIIHRFTELAQWSDLIIFDYLIANLDRVVNNLYNYQWNADMMTAPAHNLARLKNSQLLVFLDNESGLLHGYRLLKKYEAYHGLLLNNLCIFRRPTIDALHRIRQRGVGHLLQELYEITTSDSVRDVLPPLPEKSIKILNDRIDRVLSQVQKCKELFIS